MKCAVIGLGRMGQAIAYRLLKANHAVLGYDINVATLDLTDLENITIIDALDERLAHVDLIWIMVPAGKPVDEVLAQLLRIPHLKAIIVDGGNSYFKDSIKRAQLCAQQGLAFLDCGTSGGVSGKDLGFCLMIGGPKDVYERILGPLRAIAAPAGFGLVGPSGAGHYVKMVHNGIEYGILQAYAEGFQLLKEGSFVETNLDCERISDLWNHGSIIRSWILQLTQNVFKQDQSLDNVSGRIDQGGTGQWTLHDAQEHNIDMPVLHAALVVRQATTQGYETYATKLVACIRHEFGGHAIHYKNEETQSS